MKTVDSSQSGVDILYLGNNCGTSRHRAEALRRLGHRVEIIDPWDFFPRNSLLRRIITKLVYEAGAHALEPYIRRRLGATLNNRRFKVAWNDQCVLLGQSTAAGLRRNADCLVTYVLDDPFGPRDKRRFRLFRHSLHKYDLVVVVRQPNVAEAFSCGARKVLRLLRSADEVAHHPVDLDAQEKKRWSSEVAFVGTWMPERGPFLARLLEMGLPLRLYGDRWQKAREWPLLRRAWRGPNLTGEDYVKAVQAAKVCLGLLSKGNRDLHTTRSAEIPYIGSVLCAERTVEHAAMYREDTEAVFWSGPEECVRKCFDLLSDEHKRLSIARAGHERCMKNGYFNEPTVKSILISLFKVEKSTEPTYGQPTWCSR